MTVHTLGSVLPRWPSPSRSSSSPPVAGRRAGPPRPGRGHQVRQPSRPGRGLRRHRRRYRSRWAGLAVEVREIVRVSQHVVELHLVVVNTGAADVDLAARLAAGPGGENPFSSAALAEPDGRKRVFRPARWAGPPPAERTDGIVAPGEAHPVWVRFPSPSGGAVDVLLPGLPPIRGSRCLRRVTGPTAGERRPQGRAPWNPRPARFVSVEVTTGDGRARPVMIPEPPVHPAPTTDQPWPR